MINVVKLNSKVTIENYNKHQFIVILVDSNKVNLKENKISERSPLGKALLEHKEKKDVRVQTPEGEKIYRILAIK